MFWDRSFDGLGYLYKHFPAIKDIEKTKNMCVIKPLQHLGTYLIRGSVLGRDLLEVDNSSNKQVDELRLVLSRVKEAQVTNQTLFTFFNERIHVLERELKSTQEERDYL